VLKQRLYQFRYSIRLRLVMSYLFVAFLAVTLVGVLGTALIHASAVRREEENLTLYAELARSQIQLLVTSDSLYTAEIQAVVERIARLGNLRVRVLSSASEIIADSGHPASLEDLQRMANQMAQQGNLRVIIRDEQGNLLAESGSGSETTEMIFSFTMGSTSGENGSPAINIPSNGNIPIYVQAMPARSGAVKILPLTSETGLIAQIEVSEGPSIVAESMQAATRAFYTASWGAILASLLVGLSVSARLSAPLRKLTGAVEKMQTGDLSARAATHGRDEVHRLATQFNAMAQRLEASFGELKGERDTLSRFVADASHELRTPITALQMFTELLESSNEDPQERAELIQEIQAEVARLTWITNNLLDLSRMDAGMVQLNLELCQAAEILQAAISARQTLAAERGIGLQITPPPPGMVVSCDRPRMELALGNLLDNAIKFTPSGGKVHAGIQVEAGEISFWVKDNGPGIQPEDLAHVFERFYRGKDRNVPGSGLGLAIVKSVVELHQGQVEITSLPGQGACVSIRLPLIKYETPSPTLPKPVPGFSG
jgi:signal transduction histidine kinase